MGDATPWPQRFRRWVLDLVEEFRNPVVKCQWPPKGAVPPGYKDVLSTPVVIDLEGDGDAKIVFTAGYMGVCDIIALNGENCSVKWDKQTPGPGCSNLTESPGSRRRRKVEIVAVASGLTVFDHTGAVLASRSRSNWGLMRTRLCDCVCQPEWERFAIKYGWRGRLPLHHQSQASASTIVE